jgi:hypothetical protein
MASSVLAAADRSRPQDRARLGSRYILQLAIVFALYFGTVELHLVSAAVLAASLLVFGRWTAVRDDVSAFVVFPFVVWTALRFRIAGAALTSLISAGPLELNQRLWVWIEQVYHRSEHGGLGTTPLLRWQRALFVQPMVAVLAPI